MISKIYFSQIYLTLHDAELYHLSRNFKSLNDILINNLTIHNYNLKIFNCLKHVSILYENCLKEFCP